MRRYFAPGIMFVSIVALQPAKASSIVDGCAPALKHDELTFTNDLAATFAYMNTINSSNFDQESASAALSAVVDAVPVSFDFNYFSQKRSQLMQMSKYNESIKQQQSYLMRHLSSNASAAYSACVTALLQQPTVILQPVNESPEGVIFRLYFKGSNDASSDYDLTLSVSGGKIVGPVAKKWRGTATQDITVKRDSLNKDVSVNVNAVLQGIPKFSDSILFTTPAVYEKKVLSSTPLVSVASTAGCGGGDSGQDVYGNTVTIHAVKENEFIVQGRPMDDAPGGQWTPGTGSTMKIIVNDGKTLSGQMYCVVGNRNVRSIANGHLEGILQRISIRKVKPR